MKKEDLIEGAILLLDKPIRWSSFDVVNKVRWLISKKLDIPRIKVGHAGTLDPLATGLLVLCTGKKTKLIETLQADKKEYIATIGLGYTTPSYDLETLFDASYPTSHIDENLIREALKKFEGEIEQIPPLYSAKQVNGKRAYKIARKGKDFQLPAQKINIYELELLSFKDNEINLRILCSKGTYIRSLAHDLGKALHSGGYLKSLRRTKSGIYDVKDAFSLQQLEEFLLNLQTFS